MTRIRLLALALMSIGFTACLESTVPAYNTVENTTFDSSLGVDLANSTSTDAGVYFRDITVGTGAGITSGQDTYMFYHAYFSNGVEFDSRQPPDLPAVIRVGENRLLPGFEIGLQGMKVGGVRQILVPPQLAYGLSDYRAGDVLIPGNSVLVFNVELVNADGSTGATSTP
jgi:FKBP-type peptidyl-prolyl cis-trans isomerase